MLPTRGREPWAGRELRTGQGTRTAGRSRPPVFAAVRAPRPAERRGRPHGTRHPHPSEPAGRVAPLRPVAGPLKSAEPMEPLGPAESLGPNSPWAEGLCSPPPHPADRTQHGRTPSRRRPTLFARRHLRLLARSEPAASARRAVVGRRGGRSVHGVPRLEHLSVGLRASSAGSCLLPRGRLASPRSVKLPIQPYPTHIPTAYGQVWRECDIARSTLTGRPAPDWNRSRPYRAVLRAQMSPRSPANRGTSEPSIPSTTGRRAPIRRHPTDPAPHRSGSQGPTDADPR